MRPGRTLEWPNGRVAAVGVWRYWSGQPGRAVLVVGGTRLEYPSEVRGRGRPVMFVARSLLDTDVSVGARPDN